MNTTKDFLLNPAIWIGLSIGISLLISLFVPFPFSIIGIVVVLVLMGYYFRKKRVLWNNRSRM
jgi:4-hydroxybenzoate polyprenyltransferase